MKKAPQVELTKELQAANKALAPALKRLQKLAEGLKPKELALGAAADLLYQLRGTTSALNALTEPLAEQVAAAAKALEESFISRLEVGEASGVQGHAARVQVTDSAVPTVENWDLFYKHVAKTKAFELLNRAVNRKAVEERWEQKKRVPGVGVFHAKKVSCTKLNGKK